MHTPASCPTSGQGLDRVVILLLQPNRPPVCSMPQCWYPVSPAPCRHTPLLVPCSTSEETRTPLPATRSTSREVWTLSPFCCLVQNLWPGPGVRCSGHPPDPHPPPCHLSLSLGWQELSLEWRVLSQPPGCDLKSIATPNYTHLQSLHHAPVLYSCQL